MNDQFRAAMDSTEEKMKALQAAYSRQVAQFSTELTGQLMINIDEAGKFKPLVRRGRYLHNLVKSMSPKLLDGVYDLLLQSSAFSLDELAVLPNSGDIARPSLLTLEKTAGEGYKRIFNDMKSLTVSLVDGLKTEIEALTVSPKSMNLSAKILASKTNHTVGQAKTLINTGMAQVQREVYSEALDSMPEKKNRFAVYMGPDDRVTRPFCDVLVGKAINSKLFPRLKNNQKGASSFTLNCGGWNCRHRLLPVTSGYIERNKIPKATARTVAKANAAAKEKKKRRASA